MHSVGRRGERDVIAVRDAYRHHDRAEASEILRYDGVAKARERTGAISVPQM